MTNNMTTEQRLIMTLHELDKSRQNRHVLIQNNQELKSENKHLKSLLAQIGYRGKDTHTK